jgi:hypothetical protein
MLCDSESENLQEKSIWHPFISPRINMFFFFLFTIEPLTYFPPSQTIFRFPTFSAQRVVMICVFAAAAALYTWHTSSAALWHGQWARVAFDGCARCGFALSLSRRLFIINLTPEPKVVYFSPRPSACVCWQCGEGCIVQPTDRSVGGSPHSGKTAECS